MVHLLHRLMLHNLHRITLQPHRLMIHNLHRITLQLHHRTLLLCILVLFQNIILRMLRSQSLTPSPNLTPTQAPNITPSRILSPTLSLNISSLCTSLILNNSPTILTLILLSQSRFRIIPSQLITQLTPSLFMTRTIQRSLQLILIIQHSLHMILTIQ